MPRSRRRRTRPGVLERPVSGRLYRMTWATVLVPVFVAAFSISRPDPLQPSMLPATFDGATAYHFAAELATRYPDRTPGQASAQAAARWVARQLEAYGFDVSRFPFRAKVPGHGSQELVNVVGVSHSSVLADRPLDTVVLLAHRDNLAGSPGANDNASGTGALLELARTLGAVELDHTLLLISSDGGAYGGLGAAELARRPELLERAAGVPGAVISAVLVLDSIGHEGRPRIIFTGERARTAAGSLLASADAALLATTGERPQRSGLISQLIESALPFSSSEQEPFLAHGIPALTITTTGPGDLGREADTVRSLEQKPLLAVGEATQELVLRLDRAAEGTRGAEAALALSSFSLRGWAVQFLLLTMLLPFLVTTLDLFARCRRQHVSLTPALRSLRSRGAVAVWVGVLFVIFVSISAFPSGSGRVLPPGIAAAHDWPLAALLAFAALVAVGWLLLRPRPAPTAVTRRDELGGHLAAMLALAVTALVVAATNPFALLFILPSLHAWLWLANVRAAAARITLFLIGFAGVVLLVLTLASQLDLGLDALWYLVTLAAVGAVPAPLVLAFLAWLAIAAQIGTIVARRSAPALRREEGSAPAHRP